MTTRTGKKWLWATVFTGCMDLLTPFNCLNLNLQTDVEKMIFWKEMFICPVLLCSLLVMGKRNKHNFLLAYDSLQVTFWWENRKSFVLKILWYVSKFDTYKTRQRWKQDIIHPAKRVYQRVHRHQQWHWTLRHKSFKTQPTWPTRWNKFHLETQKNDRFNMF